MKRRKFAVLIACFSEWYDKRLSFIEKYLQNNSYRTVILISDYDHMQKAKDTHLLGNKNIKYISVPEYKKNLSLKRLISHRRFAEEAKSYIASVQPDLVYVIVPPNSLVKELAELKEEKKFKLVFDVVDMWPESFPLPKADVSPFLNWKNLRNKYINNADLVILECTYYKETLKKYVDDEKFRTLHLVKPPLNMKPDYSNQIFDGTIRLAYLGSINNLIDISSICKVIEYLRNKYPVEVHVIGKGEKEKDFLESLRNAGAKVTFYGTVFEDDRKYEIFRNCQFGLNIYKQNIKVGLTLKSIDYMQLGLPLINNIKGDTYQLVYETGIGLNISEDDNLEIDALKQMVEHIGEVKMKVQNVFHEKFSTEKIDERVEFLRELL